MNRNFLLILLILVGVLLLSGCNLPGPEVKCPLEDLVAPSLISPASHAQLTTLKPTFFWSFEGFTYPYPQPYPTPSVAYNCSADRFLIMLFKAPYFTEQIGPPYNNAFTGYTWDNYPPLENGKTYRWNVIPIRDGAEGPSSEFRYFSIGAACTAANLGAPVLIAPADGSIVQTLNPAVMYDTLMGCLPKGYVAEYSKDPTFAHKASYGGGGYYGYGLPLGPMENCETYYWRVAAYVNSTSTLGPYSDVWSFEVKLPNTICQNMIEIPDLIPELIPSSPPDPGDFIWEVIRDAKCRLGPATAYPETGYLPIGHMAKVLGRNEDGTWFQVIDPNGKTCWGSILAFDPEGWQTLEISRYDPPPTETPTPTAVPPYNCAQHTDYNSCNAQYPVCSYDRVNKVCKNN